MIFRRCLLTGLLSLPVFGWANSTVIPEAENPSAIAETVLISSETDDDFIFDSTMFRGSQISQEVITRLSKKNRFEPGQYDVSVFMNKRASGQDLVQIALVNNEPEICMSESLFNKAGFLPQYRRELTKLLKQQTCVPVSLVVPEAKVELDSELSLQFSAPQSVLEDRPEGAIAISELNEGTFVAFANYTLNQYHTQQRGNTTGNSDYTYLNLNSGINLGLWQYRQISTYNYSHSKYSGKSNSLSKWHTISNYVQRAIPQLQSKLVIGETNTTGQYLSGLNYTGLELASDERMQPTSRQGYAPVVTGIAKTNAVVEVRQNGNLIYQTLVPNGAFAIRDLNPTNYGGDLDVTVIEADNSRTQFTVPFSAVPDSLRMGRTKYSVAAGKTRDQVDDTYFFDTNIQHGLNNSFTLGIGARLAEHYQAGLVSTVFANNFGAFGLNTTYSYADLGSGKTHNGWMASLTYSKSIQPTQTNISLAGYRYSTKGYREFTDFIHERYSLKNDKVHSWASSTYLQHYRLMMTVAQPLGEYGNLSFSASTQEYRDGRPRDTQYQVSYNKSLPKGITMSLNVSRQRTNYLDRTDKDETEFSSKYNTVGMVSFNIPLGSTRSALSTSATFDKENGDNYQASLSGSLGDYDSPYNYSANVNYDEKYSNVSYAANLHKNNAFGSTSLNASYGKNYWQGGFGHTGSLVLHNSGLTAGPYLSETFAIIEAKGAEGATVFNGQGAVVNRFGHAIVPSLVPYRYNAIAISPDGLKNNHVDIEANEYRIAPYAGAAVKVRFKTNAGYPVLLTLQNDASIPMGADVVDQDGNPLGMVGQNNQAYFRAPDKTGTVKIIWGSSVSQQCTADYKVPTTQKNASLIKLSVVCH